MARRNGYEHCTIAAAQADVLAGPSHHEAAPADQRRLLQASARRILLLSQDGTDHKPHAELVLREDEVVWVQAGSVQVQQLGGCKCELDIKAYLMHATCDRHSQHSTFSSCKRCQPSRAAGVLRYCQSQSVQASLARRDSAPGSEQVSKCAQQEDNTCGCYPWVSPACSAEVL